MREISLSNRLLTCLVVGNYMTKRDLGGYFKQDSHNAVFSRPRQNPDRLTRLPLGRLSPLLVRLRENTALRETSTLDALLGAFLVVTAKKVRPWVRGESNFRAQTNR